MVTTYTSEKPINDRQYGGHFFNDELISGIELESVDNIINGDEISCDYDDNHQQIAGLKSLADNFFNRNHDLMPAGCGVITHEPTDELPDLNGLPRHTSTTLGIDMRPHIEGAKLRSNGKGRFYYGSGIVAWQLIRQDHLQVKTVELESGYCNNGKPKLCVGRGKTRLQDGASRILAEGKLSGEDIADLHETVQRIIGSSALAEQLVSLRAKRARTIREMADMMLNASDQNWQTYSNDYRRQTKLMESIGLTPLWSILT